MPGRLFVYWLVFAFLALLIAVYPLIIAISRAVLMAIDIPEALHNLGYETNRLLSMLVPVALMYVCWPGLTIMTLMIFRQTMRQARIKPDHVVRCAVYSSDALILWAIPLLLFSRSQAFDWDSAWSLTAILLHPFIAALLLLALLLLTWRLATAYRMYLRFPVALFTCVLSQVVVVLFMLTAYLYALWMVRGN
jgi:hypothetical protein